MSRVSPRKVDRPERRSTASSEKIPTLPLPASSPSPFSLRESVYLRSQAIQSQTLQAQIQSQILAVKSTLTSQSAVQSPSYAAPLPSRTFISPTVAPSRIGAVTTTTLSTRRPNSGVAVSTIPYNNNIEQQHQHQRYDDQSSDEEDDDDSDTDEIFSGGLETTGGLVMGSSPSLNSRQLDLYYQTLQKSRNVDVNVNVKQITNTRIEGAEVMKKTAFNTTQPYLINSALEREMEALTQQEKEEEKEENIQHEIEGKESIEINLHKQEPILRTSIYTNASGGGEGEGVKPSNSNSNLNLTSPLSPFSQTPTRVPSNLTPTQLALFRRTLAPTSSPSALLNAHIHSTNTKASDLRRLALNQSAKRGGGGRNNYHQSPNTSSLPSPHLMTVSTLALDELALASLRDNDGNTTNEEEDDDSFIKKQRENQSSSSSSSLSSTLDGLVISQRGQPVLGKSGMRAATKSVLRAEAAHNSSPFSSSSSFSLTKFENIGREDLATTFSSSPTINVSSRINSVNNSGGSNIINSSYNDRDQQQQDHHIGVSSSSSSSSSSATTTRLLEPFSSPMRVNSSISKTHSSETSVISPSIMSQTMTTTNNEQGSTKTKGPQTNNSLITSSNNDPDPSLDDFASLLVSPNRAQNNVNLHGSSVETRFQAMLDAKFKQIGGDDEDL
jgi:hypothetical protein